MFDIVRLSAFVEVSNVIWSILSIHYFQSAHPVCKLKEKTGADNETVCDIAGSRTKIELGGEKDKLDLVTQDNNLSRGDQAAWIIHKETQVLPGCFTQLPYNNYNVIVLI